MRAEFQEVILNIGQGTQMIGITVGEISVEAGFIEQLLTKALEKFGPDALITMTFRKATFASGHDLKEFADKICIELNQGDVEQ